MAIGDDSTVDFFQIIDMLVDHAIDANNADTGTSYRFHAGKVRKAVRTLAVRLGIPLDPWFKGMLDDRFGGDGPVSKVRNQTEE